MLKYFLDIYSRIYRFIPTPLRRTGRSIYSSLGLKNNLNMEDVKKIRAFYESIGIIKPGNLVFDVGASIGIYTEAFWGLGARVVAVEPLPDCAGLLKKRFKHDSRVVVIEKGVGSEVGQLELFISGHSVASTFSKDFKKSEEVKNKTDYIRSISVPITTLDTLIAEYGVPDYCKIDVEGFEKKVLSGLSKRIPILSFEFHSHSPDEVSACCAKLSELGYTRFNFTCDNPDKLVLADWTTCDDFLMKFMQYVADKPNSPGDIFAQI